MHEFLIGEDYELWDIIHDSPYVPMKFFTEGQASKFVPQRRKEYSNADKNQIKKNFKAKKAPSLQHQT